MQERHEGRGVDGRGDPPRRRPEQPQRRDGDRLRDGDRPRRRPLPAMEAARAGLEQLAMVTGREAQGVVSLEPAEDGWLIGVEVVEDRRIPSSTDVLALYQAEIDGGGELIAYSRKGRYPRGKSDSGELGR